MPLPFEFFPGYYLFFLLAAGLWLLTYGGDWLSQGASSLALRFRINPVVVGLTVVSIATSMPEMITSLVAAANGSAGLAVGNIVGSNLCNLGLILGIAALISPLSIQSRLIRMEVPVLFAVTLLFGGMAWGWMGGVSLIGRWEGILLLVGTVGYLIYLIRGARQGLDESTDHLGDDLPPVVQSSGLIAVLILVGSAALAIGAELVFRSSVELAHRLDVNETLIGLTIVAVGTSLPELAASIAAAVRKQSDIVAGNIIGSNIFNMLLIGGATSTAYTLPIQPNLLGMEFPAMLGLTGLTWYLFWTGKVVTRREGLLLVVVYTGLITASIFTQPST